MLEKNSADECQAEKVANNLAGFEVKDMAKSKTALLCSRAYTFIRENESKSMAELEIGNNLYLFISAVLSTIAAYIGGHRMGCKHERKKRQ